MKPLLILCAASLLPAQSPQAILDTWCNSCHRAGQVGPFDFTSHEGAAAYAPEILNYVNAGKMPPWRAKAGPVEFSNARKMPGPAVATLLQWANAPRKTAWTAPAVSRHPQWNLGAPDLIVTAPREHTVEAEKTVDIVSFEIPRAEFGKRKYLQAFEVRPSNRTLLHHVVLRAGGQAFGAWAMCDSGFGLPPGTAWELPASEPLVVELHYFKRTLRPARDLTKIAFYFAKTPPSRVARAVEIEKRDFRIPAGANLHEVRAEYRLAADVQLLAVLPVFQLLAGDVRLKLRSQKDWLLWVQPFEHHLMSSYALAKPLPLAKGTVLDLQATYDNSAQNEFNPHKTLRDVVYGENGLDETFRYWLTVSEGRKNATNSAAQSTVKPSGTRKTRE
jgi:hypothetical protein